jgi:arsenate reductase
MDVTIYHNPRCSKSRQTLKLLEENGIEPIVVEYLDQPPSADELTEILLKMGVEPRDIMRKNESVYKEYELADPSLTDDALIAAMVGQPILIERPIVVTEEKATIGRPPSAVLEIL